MISYEAWHRQKTCLNKRRIDSKAYAKKVIKTAFGPSHEKMNAYRCQYCGYFHIGHKGRYDLQSYETWRTSRSENGSQLIADIQGDLEMLDDE
jgi:hypothetical protein